MTDAGASRLGRIKHEAGSVKVLAEAGIVRPMRPDRFVRIAGSIRRWGRGPASGTICGAIAVPDETAIIDERGELTFAEVDRRTNALARGFAAAGVEERDRVALMCRNHRWFVESTTATAKLGANVLYLNTAFAAPQLAEVLEREQPKLLLYDEEFTGLLPEAGGGGPKRFVAWADDEQPLDQTLEQLIASNDPAGLEPPDRMGRAIILTSGTTGTPKGADRGSPQTLDPATSLLSKIPLKARGIAHIAAPLFHTWGFAHFSLGMLLQSTFTLRRKFDPEQCLAEIERTRAASLVVVPVMLQRILELPEEVRAKYDTSSLTAVPVSGSALPGKLAEEWMDAFGDNLYNLYGSTEVAWASIATPEDLRAAPGTAGRIPRGTVVRIYDSDGNEAPVNEPGRIFVANEMLFAGYTGGGSKDSIDGLLSTGDVGRLDAAGRLFVEGRDDEMIISGGENLFPKEVEDVIASREDVVEVAAIGIEDEQFGQRLRAFVVRSPGAELSEADVKAHVKSNLANYKVPREVWFLEELPRNATGKILKRELKQLESAP